MNPIDGTCATTTTERDRFVVIERKRERAKPSTPIDAVGVGVDELTRSENEIGERNRRARGVLVDEW